MTRYQKKKIARHNADKNRLKSHITVSEYEESQKYILREYENIENYKNEFREDYTEFICCRLCVAFLASLIKVSSKYMTIAARASLYDDFCLEMRDAIENLSNDDDAWEDLKKNVESYGYEVPLWALVDCEREAKIREQQAKGAGK